MATTNDKMTNRKALAYVMDNFELPEDVSEKIQGMIAQLDKKNGAERKPTARQLENQALTGVILNQMEDNVLYTVDDIRKGFTGLPDDISCQRLSGILTKMVDAGTIVRTMDKRKPLFSKAC